MDLNRATGKSPEIQAVIDDMFQYHAWTPDQVAIGAAIRIALSAVVSLVVETVPPGPDRTVAIRKLRDARMDLNSAITHGGKY